MKFQIKYYIRLNSIDDSILKELQNWMIDLKFIPEYNNFIKQKYNRYFSNQENNDIDTGFFYYNSQKHKKLLEFFCIKNLKINKNIFKNSFSVIKYNKKELDVAEYFRLKLSDYTSSMSENCDCINVQKFKSNILTENFIIYDNSEPLVCNRDIVKKIEFQEYYTGVASVYFISKSLGEYMLDNNFTGFKLLPVKKINTNETLFYQVKIINVIEEAQVKTEVAILNDNTNFVYPSKDSKYHNYYKKRDDVSIYNQEYIENTFKDFNMYYYTLEDFRDENNIMKTHIELIVSKRVMLLLKKHKSRFYKTPIFSNENIYINKPFLDPEIKQLINNISI